MTYPQDLEAKSNETGTYDRLMEQGFRIKKTSNPAKAFQPSNPEVPEHICYLTSPELSALQELDANQRMARGPSIKDLTDVFPQLLETTERKIREGENLERGVSIADGLEVIRRTRAHYEDHGFMNVSGFGFRNEDYAETERKTSMGLGDLLDTHS